MIFSSWSGVNVCSSITLWLRFIPVFFCLFCFGFLSFSLSFFLSFFLSFILSSLFPWSFHSSVCLFILQVTPLFADFFLSSFFFLILFADILIIWQMITFQHVGARLHPAEREGKERDYCQHWPTQTQQEGAHSAQEWVVCPSSASLSWLCFACCNCDDCTCMFRAR